MPAARDHIDREKVPVSPKFVHSAPIPLEPDSDPDFNPGAYVCEPPKKGRKSRKTASPKGHNLPRDALDSTGTEKRTRKQTTQRHGSTSQNPLLEYFGELVNDLGLELASEDEGKKDDELDDPDVFADNEEDEEQVEEQEGEEAHGLKTYTALIRESQSQAQSAAEDSATESETEPDDDTPIAPATSSLLKRKSTTPPSGAPRPPSKKAKTESPDDSVTEPESDEDPNASVARFKSREDKPVGKRSPSDSVTESETESESEAELSDSEDMLNGKESHTLHPRPTFPLKPKQKLLGPLVLDSSHEVPARINTFLREYQRGGVRFFWERYADDKGGLLGDDMGLVRKTIQVISFLSAIMQKHGDERDIERRRKHVSDVQDISKDWKERRILPPANATWPTCLIIAPSSVVGNWEREFETWGYFEVGMYVGTPSARADVLNDFRMGRLDVVLTSFDVARRDIELLDELAWSCVIIDEVHRVKNPNSKITKAFSQFECSIRFGLTGTAIQNSYLELWNILNWTNPGLVGTKGQWEGYVVKPLTVGQSKTASDEEHMKAALVAKILKEKLLPKFFLRRTKFIIKDQLPKKIDEVVFCPLTTKQTEVYKRIINMETVQNLIRKDEPCDCGSRESVLLHAKYHERLIADYSGQAERCCHPFDKGDLFKYMSTLIKVSNHLALILPSPTDTAEQTARNRELARVAFQGEAVPKYGPAILTPRFCGKWMVLETLLEEWKKDSTNKVLIFTKSVKLLEMLEFHLGSLSLGFVKLDGSTKQSERMSIIDKFHEDPDIVIFLISTLAGGTGLNLTGANKVVIFDPNWNPAHDLQAMDRAYRFGQTRDVSVYRLLGAGSIEELIYARQVYKQQQMLVGYNASLQTRYFEGVQGEKNKQGELFGMKNIFKLHEHTSTTKMAIERASLVDLDWALAHLDAKKKRKSSPSASQWVYEAEAKGGKEYGDLSGLGALLLDDSTPKLDDQNSDIQKTLNDIGINYTHRNEDLIAESAIEGQRLQAMIEEKKKAKKKANIQQKEAADKSPEPEWPPKRKHHKPPLTPRDKLFARQLALIQLGMIKTASDLSGFAQQFARKTPEEQNDILAQLDAHAKKHHI